MAESVPALDATESYEPVPEEDPEGDFPFFPPTQPNP
jgi:hypothetical protein